MRVLLGLLLAAVAAAAPELLRQEPFNFRVVGKLPPGWQRNGDKLAWAFEIDGIPHAYVHLHRERLRGVVDVEKEVRARVPHYAFPGQPKDAAGAVTTTTWAKRPAVRYELATTVQGIACRRRVTAICVKSVWYELIETVYGERSRTMKLNMLASTRVAPATANGMS